MVSMGLMSNRCGLLLMVIMMAWCALPIATAAGDDANQEVINLVIDELKSGDPERQAGAIAIVRDIPGEGITKSLAEELPKLSPAVQVQLLSTLADRGDAVALPAVIEAAKAQDESVRVAALRAVGQLGNAESIPMLAQRAAESRGQEQKAARDSLYRLRGSEMNATILGALAGAEPDVKVELIRAVGERNIVDGVATVLGTATDENRKVRVESFKVLKIVADPSQLPALVNLTLNLKSDSDRNEAEKTVAAVAHKMEDPNRQAASVLAVLPSVGEVDKRASLLRILGRIGDNSALPVLRTALTSREAELQDAAIRALSDWPTPEPLNDLLKVVQTSVSPVHKILALRGFVRLLGLANDRSAGETIELYKKAMELAPNATEKKRVLSGLGGEANLPALQMASQYLDDPSLKVEAESAVVRIAEQIDGKHPQESREALDKVVKNTGNATLREQAQSGIDRIDTQ
jgi:HEAT repeat protein